MTKQHEEIWNNAEAAKKLDQDEERYIDLMNEDELNFEEHQWCKAYEKKMELE